ncbi:hypothetical protein BGZ63DRAFT_463304 [Mariannaea sp. PMI_226]|nr:hypothetical protein BGZ63DRAFT_463304 [Mariannaea sp. PMI_226]
MPSSERDTPRDGELALRHQQSSSSDHSLRALVPMWDSSDPDRCPPPLPLNPQSPHSFSSRAGTSSAIQSAHAAMSERARESALVMKPSSHRRMQSLQPTSVRDLSLMIEGGTSSGNVSPSRSPDKFFRPQTPVRSKDDARSPERESSNGTPTPGPSLTPIVRPIVRRPHQSILGENTPPQSSTMLALQSMGTHNSPYHNSTSSNNNENSNTPTPAGPQPPPRDAEPPLSNITNSSTALVRQPQHLDHLSNQILSLTNIATSLQKEMAQLSRRSRDNATDLLSLREATNTRDEDIRKSLRELIHKDGSERHTMPDPFRGYYLDNKPHDITLNPTRASFQLPRVTSPKSFMDSIDRASISTPSLAGSEAPPSVALLEKIIREMGTKEGQENLLNRLTEVSQRLSGMATAAKVDELVDQVRSQSEHAIVLNESAVSRHYSFDDDQSTLPDHLRSGPVSQRVEHLMKNESRRNSEPSSGRGAGLLNDDLIKIIRSVKDSVAQGGGLTAEVKALVRELRGEVLGMGREIGRRLEQAASHRPVDDHDSPSKDEVARVIDEGLEQMKDQLNHVLREHRRVSGASSNTQKPLVDYQEIYNALRAALQDNEATQTKMPDLRREDVIEAVKEAWENYKPEIEVQQLGLERDEVLACLQQGLQEYAPRDDRPPAATRDEVFTAVVEGLRHFVPPQVDTPASMSRDEIIEAVRDCLEDFEFPVAASAVGGSEITHDDVVHAVREGLHEFDINSARALPSPTVNNDDIAHRLNEITHLLHEEFKAVSEEAKNNVAANGRDTEQVLDATKDGLENLRVAIEGYVDRAAGVTAQEDFLDDLIKSLEDFKDEIAGMVLKTQEDSRGQLQTELDGLREVVNNSMVPAAPAQAQFNNQEILEALNTGFNNLRQEILRPRAETSEILDALNDGLNDLRAGMDRVQNKPADLTANDEILDALKVGLDSVRSDIDTIREGNEKALTTMDTPPEVSSSNEVLEVLKSGLDAVRSDIDSLRESTAERAVATVDSPDNTNEILDALKDGLDAVRSDIESLRETTVEKAVATVDPTDGTNEILDALRNGLDAVRLDIDSLRETTAERAVATVDSPDNANEILDALRDGLDAVRTDIGSLRDISEERTAASVPEQSSNEEILDALKSGLESVRSDIEALRDSSSERAITAVDSAPSNLDEKILDALKSGLDAVRSDIESLRDSNHDRALTTVSAQPEGDEESVSRGEPLKHDDIRNLEFLISELRLKVESMEPEKETNQKDDFGRMEEMIRNVQDAVDELSSREPATTTRAVGREDPNFNGEDAASKDDVQAIETILRNTKSRLDDLVDSESVVRKDHIDALETLLLETRQTMTSLVAQFDSVPSKEEISGLECLVSQVTAGIDELKESAVKESENPEKVCKSDVETVEAAVLELKTALESVTGTDFATFASKDDVANLQTIVKAFEEKLDNSFDSTTKAVAIRDEEMTGVGQRVTEVKSFLEDFQEIIKSKLEEGSAGVESISKLLEAMGEKMDKNETVSSDLGVMFETMKSEFEDSKAVMSGVKVESNEKLEEATAKFEEATVTLGTKIDEKIDEVIAKYDDLQTMLDEKSKVSEARDIATEEAAVGTKAVTDELKLLIDTLGSTVTDSMEKMEEASKTVFTQVEDLVLKTDENHTEEKAEHQQTRDRLTQALDVVEGLKGEVTDFQPKILEAVKDVLLLVGEHFEHSKSATTELQDHIAEAKPSEALKMLLPPEKYDNTEVHEKLNKLAEQKYDDSHVLETLAVILSHKYDDAEVRQRLDQIIEQKYDDTEVREKLSEIIEHKYDDTPVHEKLGQIIEQKYDDTEVREKLDLIVAQKYDDTEVRDKLELIAADKYDDTVIRDKLDLIITDKYDDKEVHEKLDSIAESVLVHKYDDADVRERLDRIIEQKYDDTPVHEKLDRIVEHNTSADQAFTRLDTLDQVHATVVKTAAEISAFLSSQTQRIESDHEDREKTLQDTILATERKLAEKEHVEASVLSLRDEEERLRQSIMSLRTEQESLIRQKTRLTADVSSLETAMRLRKDELYEMEGRAESLERRILEGVMDHSRVLLMSKANKGGDAMSRKRVKKPANDGESTSTPKKQAVNMALANRRSLAPPGQTGATRRIVSLGQINNNVASTGFKRSQSVRTPAGRGKAYRKRSWGGDLDNGFGGNDKENVDVGETVEELDEHPETGLTVAGSELPGDETTVLDSAVDGDGRDSDTETLRRSSRGTVVTNSTDMYTESESGYSEYSETGSEWTESVVGSALGTDTDHEPEGNELVVYGSGR